MVKHVKLQEAVFKKKLSVFGILLVLLSNLLSVSAVADVLPAPSLVIDVDTSGLDGNGIFHLDLLSKGTIDYDSLSNLYDESYLDEPIYKYNKDGWYAVGVRSKYIHVITDKDGPNSEYVFIGDVPRSFKVIVQLESGNLYVSKEIYEMSDYINNIKISFAEEMEKVVEELCYGDLNGDGKCNSTDLSLMKRFLLGNIMLPSPSINGIMLADFNGDGIINSTDYALLKRKVLGLIDKFPVENNNSTNIIPEKIDTDVIQADSKFAFDIFKQLNKEDEDKNIFISPLSISTVLSMVGQGAKNDTKEQMWSVLGYDGINEETLKGSYKSLINYLNQSDEKVNLKMSNSLWLNEYTTKGVKFNQDFIAVNENIFKAKTEIADFSKQEGVDSLNNWISDATYGMIKGMIQKEDVIDSVITLVNAIYFKGYWNEEFDKDLSVKRKFYKENGSSDDVMMMRKSGDMPYGEGNGYKAVKLPYGNKKTALYCILPDEGTSINEFISNMDHVKWEQIRRSIYVNNVRLEMPRFKIEYDANRLKSCLINLGMSDAFSMGIADFTGICESGEKLYLGDVKHKAVIEVNEEGSEASASTVVIAPSVGPVYKYFYANRPFVFVIADEENGTILFMGKVCEVKE